jgi:hypothetical protein
MLFHHKRPRETAAFGVFFYTFTLLQDHCQKYHNFCIYLGWVKMFTNKNSFLYTEIEGLLHMYDTCLQASLAYQPSVRRGRHSRPGGVPGGPLSGGRWPLPLPLPRGGHSARLFRRQRG